MVRTPLSLLVLCGGDSAERAVSLESGRCTAESLQATGHRVRLLVKAGKTAPLQQALAEWVAQVKLPANVRLAIDIDPQSFL